MEKLERKPEYFVKIINEMLHNTDYGFAKDTLLGIRATISNTGKVTEKQMDAIHTIRRSAW